MAVYGGKPGLAFCLCTNCDRWIHVMKSQGSQEPSQLGTEITTYCSSVNMLELLYCMVSRTHWKRMKNFGTIAICHLLTPFRHSASDVWIAGSNPIWSWLKNLPLQQDVCPRLLRPRFCKNRSFHFIFPRRSKERFGRIFFWYYYCGFAKFSTARLR